jgi:hypothetical protein
MEIEHMSEHLRVSKILPSRALRMTAVLLTLLVVSSAACCQAVGPAKPDKEASKQAAKATKEAMKEAMKEAQKAIKTGNIEQLKAILQANPYLVSDHVPQGVLGAMVAAPLVSVATGGAGAPLVYAAGHGVTLLHYAADYNRKDAAELLLACNADVNARNGLGATPLHEAVLSRSWDVGRVLLDHGADVNTRWANGDTPLKTLRWERANRTRNQPLQGFNDFEQLLLQHGAQ